MFPVKSVDNLKRVSLLLIVLFVLPSSHNGGRGFHQWNSGNHRHKRPSVDTGSHWVLHRDVHWYRHCHSITFKFSPHIRVRECVCVSGDTFSPFSPAFQNAVWLYKIIFAAWFMYFHFLFNMFILWLWRHCCCSSKVIFIRMVVNRLAYWSLWSRAACWQAALCTLPECAAQATSPCLTLSSRRTGGRWGRSCACPSS